MGESSRRDRSRSPSRRHRDREDRGDHSRHHDEEKRHKHRSHDENERKHKHHRRDETDEERRERKKAKKEKRRREGDLEVVDDDGEDMWVEKGMDAETAVSNIPSADSLPLKSTVHKSSSVPLPPSTAAESVPQERESWMLDPGPLATSHTTLAPTRDIPHSATLPSGGSSLTDGYGDEESGSRTVGGAVDFFTSLGTEHKRKDPNENKPDPSKLQIDRRELNQQLVQGKSLDEYETQEKKVVPGSAGHQWRMMKLKRLYEQAEEQGRDVEEVALERYGSMEEFDEAREERRILDEREQRRQSRRGGNNSSGVASPASSGMRTPGEGRRFMFTSNDDGFGSRPPSRTGFRRPGEAGDGVQTPGSRIDQLRGTPKTGTTNLPTQPKVSTPIPSVFTPQGVTRSTSGYPFNQPPASTPDATTSKPAMSIEELNKFQARVLRAKLSDDPDAEAMEDEYEYERHRASLAGGDQGGAGMWTGGPGQMGRTEENGTRVEVQVLPTLDGHGKLYDVGLGGNEDPESRPGNRRKKPEKFETRDRQGNVLRYNADDDSQSLGELVRQERFGAGSADQKNLDAEMARAIATDGKFEDDLEYMDDNADRLARRKMKTDAMKRAFAINDYARTKRALDSCPFCYQDDRNPLTAIVALGRRTYMCCTLTEELVPGHCLIVPIQHCLSSLEMEDDDWDEVRNFMKCLMRMHAKDNKGVLFYETILSFKQQRHTYIEAVPVPFEQFQDAPAYFRESILASESEWTQHKKLIDFSQRPGGFRRALVSNLPYFMVQWDYKGEQGYGHIIEGVDDAAGRGEGEDDMGVGMDEGDKGGGAFPPYFAAEIIGNILELEPRKWRRPRKMDFALNKERARKLGEAFQPYNWTVQLQEQ